MAQADERQIHQALFGYADGHKLLEASVRLSSRELYDLGAISDLATGAQLRPDESYLTGTALHDSRYFALIRTWPAPEMPRPGCVWSHVLMLTPEFLASHGDLVGLNTLFAHPGGRQATGSYTRQIDLSEKNTRHNGAPEMVAHVLRSYYAGRPFSTTLPVGAELDYAVLAVWSQQWPRLRTAFSFRTVRTTASSSRGNVRFEFQPSMHLEISPESNAIGTTNGDEFEWVEAAVEDATSPRVTPLRRFLWRYGKDIRSPRQRFQNLVRIHLTTRAMAPNNLPLSWAESIVSLFPGEENALTLKRDLLGVEPAALALCPAVAFEDMLELLAELGNDTGVVSDQNLETRLSVAPADAVPALAASLDRHPAELVEHTDAIMRVLTKIADDRAIADVRMPPTMRLTLLKNRHDLIDQASLTVIADDDLLSLFEEIEEASRRAEIVDALLRRDLTVYPDILIREHAGDLVFRAIAARVQRTLTNGWAAIFGNRARELISSGALDQVAGSQMAAQAAELLHYPVDGELSNDIYRWLSALERPGPEADGQLRTNFEAYMCIVATKSRTPSAWDLLHRTLPSLRSVVLAGGLINPAYELLDLHLPPNGWNSWDFDKRILIALRNLRRWTGVDNAVVAHLALSEDDLEFVLENWKSKKREKAGKSIFWPWD
jgi:hypothetical protein